MTILAAVRTGAAFVLAADSKLTTQAIAGRNPDGSPNWVPQTYDHAVKLARDYSQSAIAAFSGFGNIGEQNAVDYFACVTANLFDFPSNQDNRIREIADEIVNARTAFQTKLGASASHAPAMVALVAAAALDEIAPRVWRLAFEGDKVTVNEILTVPGIWLEGSADAAFTLLYGRSNAFAEGVRSELKIDAALFDSALASQSHHCAITRINFWTMPLQDAIDFAVFCASVQIEMDRFLPGFGSCGGPIDLLTLETSPRPRIKAYPGKLPHHPFAKSALSG